MLKLIYFKGEIFMFLKKKLKIYLIMLSILALSAPINAMKKDEINENIIKTNEIKKQDFEEEDSKNNIEINKIKKEIYSEICDVKNLSTWIFMLYDNRKDLLDLKQKTNNEETKNTINNMLDEIDDLIYDKVEIVRYIVNRNEKIKNSAKNPELK